ncbi:HAMP domain-containing histidine kinase [bacterium]|nr:HAMP domain-containing histidine kinase [bacterium]
MSDSVPPPPSVRRYVWRLAPFVVVWFIPVGWVGWQLSARADWARETDEADVREWLNETRVFRKPLPELLREYAELDPSDPDRLRLKADEIDAHLAGMAEPTRQYAGKLPLFPDVFALAVDLPGRAPPAGRDAHPAWRSPVPRPGTDAEGRVRVLRYEVADGAGVIRCEYRAHTLNRFEEEQREQRFGQFAAVLVLIAGFGFVSYFAVRFLRRERAREVRSYEQRLAADRRELELTEARRAAEELERQVLAAELERAKIEGRAAEAEKSALEMKSQLYASIGIMAGSYAHNIKNLLVRPNDLLARCMEVDGLPREQHGMLQEVKITLGTVTERLQQILRTVRRDPHKTELTRIDLSDLVREAEKTWAVMAWEKWKLRLTAEAAPGPLPVTGDISHLQQAVENLVFNARDATFEMRNHLREAARGGDVAGRKQRLIDAASWKGEVALKAYRDGADVVLEVRDNGIGMTEEVRRNCLTTHFSTKRDNALYEGYSAGMGLGLSFVAVVLEHHGATLSIDSAPLKGTTFRVRWRAAEPRV